MTSVDGSLRPAATAWSTMPISAAAFNGVMLVAADVLSLIMAALIAFMLGHLASPVLTGSVYVAFGTAADARWPMFLATAGVVVVWLQTHGHYNERVPLWTELRDLAAIALLALVLEGFLQFASKEQVSRVWIMSTWILFPTFAILTRASMKRLLTKLGSWTIRTVIFGRGDAVPDVHAALVGEPMLGFQVVAAGRPGTPEQAAEMMRAAGASFAVIALGSSADPRSMKLARRFSSDGIPFAVAPPFAGLSLAGMRAQFIFGHDVMLLTERRGLLRGPARMLKRSFDVVFGLLGLLAASPLLLLAAILVASDGHSLLFEHERVGRDGNAFRCLKFRTMVPDAQQRLDGLLRSDRVARDEWARDRKLRNDPRLTRFGSFLRRSALDELPQLWNVVKGDMSLVGPRPITTDELVRYGEDVEAYLKVRPGVTGLWQISGRNDLDYRRRVALDSWYVRNWALGYDVLIIILTLPALLSRRGAY